MSFWDLPESARVQRVVPKNAFDQYTNSKQKRLLSSTIQRINWVYKLSSETINLKGSDISEIQVFRIELKEKEDISKVLEIIDKAISYHIVFWVEYQDEAYLSTSSKHAHPKNDDQAIIDWTFNSSWFQKEDCPYLFNLRVSIDEVFKDISIQIAGREGVEKETLNSIVASEKEIDALNKEIAKLESAISRCKQFNQKVELNTQLNAAKRKLSEVR